MNKRLLYCKEKYEGTVWSSDKYGEYIVINYINTRKVAIKFLSTNYSYYTTMCRIKRGGVKDYLAPSVCGVGYVGEGSFKPSIKGLDSKSYKVWHCMLQRCYDESILGRYPTYKGCSVADEWHNFQNFAKWFEDNYIEGYQLDKDSLVEGNKIYSEDTCTFISPQANTEVAHAKNYKMVSPDKVCVSIYNLRKFCRDKDLIYSCMRKVNNGSRKQHKGWTKYIPDEEKEL